jgi:hypothetical protein
MGAEVDELVASGRDSPRSWRTSPASASDCCSRPPSGAEVEAFLGRARDQRRDVDGPAGNRNGWPPPTTVRTTMGDVERQRPKLRGPDQAFCSRLCRAVLEELDQGL